MSAFYELSASFQECLLAGQKPILQAYLFHIDSMPLSYFVNMPSRDLPFYHNSAQSLLLFAHMVPTERLQEWEQMLLQLLLRSPSRSPNVGLHVFIDAWILVMESWLELSQNHSLLPHLDNLLQMVMRMYI